MDQSVKKLVLTGSVAKEAAIKCVKDAPLGYVFQIGEPIKKREQEEKYHAQIGDIAKQCEFMGEKLSLEDWKRLLVDAFAKAMAEAGTPLRRGGRVVPSLDGGGVVQLGIQTRNFRVKEAAEFIEYLYAWGSHNGVVWSDEPERKAA